MPPLPGWARNEPPGTDTPTINADEDGEGDEEYAGVGLVEE
jgi:hypothetical protein